MGGLCFKLCSDGWAPKINIFPNFSQIRSEGDHQIFIFSQIQKSPNYPRGGVGGKKIMDFSTFWDIFMNPLSTYLNTYLKRIRKTKKGGRNHPPYA